MSRPVQSSALRSPMPEADDEGRKIYLALLERRCLMLSMENLRLRACMERATGEPWDTTDLADFTSEQLDELVTQDVARGLRLSPDAARRFVEKNKRLANPSQTEVALSSDNDLTSEHYAQG